MADETLRGAAENTDVELWREREGDYYANSIHRTARGGIGINVGGTVYVKPLAEWHRLASTPAPADNALADERIERKAKQLGDAAGDPNWWRYTDAAREALRASPPREQWQDISTAEKAGLKHPELYLDGYFASRSLETAPDPREQAHNEKIAAWLRGPRSGSQEIGQALCREADAILRRDYLNTPAQEQGT